MKHDNIFLGLLLSIIMYEGLVNVIIESVRYKRINKRSLTLTFYLKQCVKYFIYPASGLKFYFVITLFEIRLIHFKF